jgi:hypothetical protein
MEWAVWKPLYLKIVRDFNYSLKADLESAAVLANIVDPSKIPRFRTIADLIGERVSICGAADLLEAELGNLSMHRTIISAGSATERLMVQGIVPDVVVTDLDGDVERQIEASVEGSLVFVHAHGDNIDDIMENVPRFTGPIVPTVQCQPFGYVYNFGGFTDGDRAYFIVKHFGAADIELVGWDTITVGRKGDIDLSVKKKKLIWAERLMNMY